MLSLSPGEICCACSIVLEMTFVLDLCETNVQESVFRGLLLLHPCAKHTWDCSRQQGNSGCGCRPKADARWEHLSAAYSGSDIAAWDLGECIAIEEGALNQASHGGTPAKVLGHGNNCHTNVDLVLHQRQRHQYVQTQAKVQISQGASETCRDSV